MPNIVSRYDFAMSSRVIRNVYTGISYTYYKTDIKPLDKSHSWNFSLLAHVGRFASASGEVQNLNHQKFSGEKSEMNFVFSAALRPLGERLTFGGNLQLYGKQRFKDASWRTSLRVTMAKGLMLYGGYSDRKTFGVGLEFHFGEGVVGGEAFFDDKTEHLGTTLYTGYTMARRDDMISGPGRILQVDLSGDIPEEKTSQLFTMKTPETVYQKLAAIKTAQKDRQVKGIF